jgi:hypothetical protein
MLFWEIIPVYCENHTEHINTLCRQNAVYINSVRASQETHYVSTTKTNRLMLFREIIAVYCENHTEHINTLWGQNAEIFINVKATGSNNCCCALIGWNICYSRGTGSHLDMSVILQVWRLLLVLREQWRRRTVPLCSIWHRIDFGAQRILCSADRNKFTVYRFSTRYGHIT